MKRVSGFYRCTTRRRSGRSCPSRAKHGVPVTFRAAGTSLSGQAITDSVLLKLSHTGRNFRNYTIHVRPCPVLLAAIARDFSCSHELCPS